MYQPNPKEKNATNQSCRQSWGVVGGGMVGLATALKLAEQGKQVTVFESAPEIGGLASSWQLGNVHWDKFYHVILLSDQTARDMLAKIGLEKEIVWVTTRTGFYTDGKLHSLSSSLDFLRFKPLNLIQKFRLGWTIFYASKIRGTLRLEGVPVDQWLRKLSGKATYERMWQPLLRAKLGESYTRTSALFIWSYIDRMYKARRSGMKREMFGYVPGGYRRVLDVLKAHLMHLGVKFQTSTKVHSVFREPGSEVLTVETTTADSSDRQTFDRVVMTVANPLIAATCKQLTSDEQARLRQSEYLGVVCTSVLLNQPLGGYYVTNITDSWVPLTGIIEMGSILDPAQLDGNYLVYLPQYMASDDARFDESDEVIHERVIATLEKMYPKFTRSSVRAIQTARARYVMTLPTLNYSQSLPQIVSSVPGLYLLNSAQITIGCLNVNEVMEMAYRELDRAVLPDSAALASRIAGPMS